LFETGLQPKPTQKASKVVPERKKNYASCTKLLTSIKGKSEIEAQQSRHSCMNKARPLVFALKKEFKKG